MDAFLVYTIDLDGKKTIGDVLYTSWDDATASIRYLANTRHQVYTMNFFDSELMGPKYEAVTAVDAEKNVQGVQYASVLNGGYKYYIMKLRTA